MGKRRPTMLDRMREAMKHPVPENGIHPKDTPPVLSSVCPVCGRYVKNLNRFSKRCEECTKLPLRG